MTLMKILDAMRLGNCAISAAGVFAGFAIAERYIGFTPMLGIAMASAFLITGAGNAVNDFFDVEVDRKQGKAKDVGKEKSWLLIFSTVLFAAGLGLAFNLTAGAFWIAVAVSALLIIYSAAINHLKFIGNLIVALGTALTLVFGAALTLNVYAVTLPAFAAFFANVGREIIKDTEDMKGDAGKKRTLPMLMKFSEIKKSVFAMYMAAIATGIVAYWLGIFGGDAFAALFIISIIILLNSFRLFSKKEFGEAQKFSKYGMVAALAAFIIGVL